MSTDVYVIQQERDAGIGHGAQYSLHFSVTGTWYL